jgi:DNA-binding SARP family transcriptional activator/TolB-like protein/Tfp pilus assembly protein PilF
MTTTAIGGQSGTVAANIANNAYLPIRPIVRIHLLGSMRATSFLGDNVLPRAKKARAALAYLCLAHGGRAPRSRIASLLWDRVSAAQARTNLRQAIFDLNAAMGSLAAELIVTGRATVRLNINVCWIDALALVKSPYSDDSTRVDLAVLCPGELLEGFDEVSASFGVWLAKERVGFKERIAGSLDAVLQQTICEERDAKQVATVARRLISFDPTHRDASRALMHALMKLGEQAEALREYERCREALWEAFRVKPDMISEGLYESIRAQVPRTRSSAADASIELHRTVTDLPRPLPGRHRLRVGVHSFNACHKEESLALSLSHEIAAGLARYRWFDVITPGSLRRSLSTGGDQHEYANLDYVLDGSISGSGKTLQISVRLLDLAGQTQPVWSEQFDIALSQLHRLDELVTMRIVARIDPVILYIEGQPKRRDRYGATGLLLMAIPMIFSMERKQYEEAGQLIQQALALEPDNSRAEAWAAHWHLFYIGQGWAKDVAKATAEVQQHALKAITLDPENAEALGIYAHMCSYSAKDFDRALQYFDRALRLNPSLAFNWALSAATYCYIGEPDIALQRLRRYRELGSPHLYYFECLYTIAYTFKGDYERAVLVGGRAVKGNPNLVAGYKPLIAALGHLGRRDEAQDYIRTLLSLERSFTVEKFGESYCVKKASDRDRYMAGLRLAGVPER